MFTSENLRGWLHEFATSVHQNRSLLTDLDSAIGDADHGANIDRGMTAVVDAIAGVDGLSALCKKAGMTLVSSVGGASGPLFGTLFLKLAGTLGDGDEADNQQLAEGLRAGVEGIATRGRSKLGEKTMLDALIPAVDALEQSLGDGESLDAALNEAAKAARAGREKTTDMVATKGRASYLGERSKGHQDPGATSAAYLIESLASAVDPA